MTEAEIEIDRLEERAAIIQDGEGCSRFVAEHTAAKQYRYPSWQDARRTLLAQVRQETGK